MRWHRLVAVPVIAVALAAGASTAASGSEEPKRDFDRSRFDPTTEALGMSTQEELERFEEALRSTNRDHPARSRMGEAVDDLYARVSVRPDIDAAREAWRLCMADRGVPADDPFEADARGWGAESVECADATAHVLEPLLAEEFEQWQKDHQKAIQTYADAIGVPRN